MECDKSCVLLAVRRCLLEAHFTRGHPLWAVWVLDRGVEGAGVFSFPLDRPKRNALLWDVGMATLYQHQSLSVLQSYAQRLVFQYMCSSQLRAHQNTARTLYDIFAPLEGMGRLSCLRLDGVCDDPWILTRLWRAQGWPDLDVVQDYVRINRSFAEIQFQ